MIALFVVARFAGDPDAAIVDMDYVTLHGVLSEAELALIEPVFEQFIHGGVPGMGRDFCDMSGPYDRKFEESHTTTRSTGRPFSAHWSLVEGQSRLQDAY